MFVGDVGRGGVVAPDLDNESAERFDGSPSGFRAEPGEPVLGEDCDGEFGGDGDCGRTGGGL